MPLIDINWNPGDRELKVFGIAWFIFFTVIAFILVGKYHLSFSSGWNPKWIAPMVLGSVAFLGAFVGLTVTRALKPVFILWTLLTYPIGFVISYAILALLYFILFTPIGLFMRLLGHDPLKRKWNPALGTYWEKKAKGNDIGSYFKQF